MNFLKLLAQKTGQNVETLQAILIEVINQADDLDGNMKKTVTKKVVQATWTAEQYAEYRATAYAAGREKAKETRNKPKKPRLTPEQRLQMAERDLEIISEQKENAMKYVEKLKQSD